MAENKWCWSLRGSILHIKEDVENDYDDFDSEEEANAWLQEAMCKLVLGIDPLVDTEYDTTHEEYQLEVLPKLKEQAREYVRLLEV